MRDFLTEGSTYLQTFLKHSSATAHQQASKERIQWISHFAQDCLQAKITEHFPGIKERAARSINQPERKLACWINCDNVNEQHSSGKENGGTVKD
ncbi:uncharacterized protein [Scyliorhinus torazame]|uniref:uncharacterized protein isoform X2 n=1 Tax=Scyliorhinus torazame TaxID=75743 RepID=UPI003B59A079